jgi:hypothetical protein
MAENLGVLAANPSVVAQATAEGAVLLEVTSGECFELNQTGAEIWTRVVKGEPLDEVVASIAGRHDIAVSLVEADARALVMDLKRRGLIISRP